MAIPGSIVGVGKLVTPGGAQGPLGGAGPTDRQGQLDRQDRQGRRRSVLILDQATLGSDSKLVLVPQSTIWNQRLRSYNAWATRILRSISGRRCFGSTWESQYSSYGSLAGYYGVERDASAALQQLATNVKVPGTNFYITSKIWRICY